MRGWLRGDSTDGHRGWREHSARLVTLALVLGLPAGLLAARLGGPGSSSRTIELVARQPAVGGWSRERIVVSQGERVRLRIRSEDVVHGFAIGRLGVDAGTIEPGKPVEVEFVADQPGEFTFYCTTWCDPNHPRMRGILEVREAGRASAPAPPSTPDIALRGLDAPREASAIPARRPSVMRGQGLFNAQCATCHGGRGEGAGRAPAIGRPEALQDWSPVQVFELLGGATPTGVKRMSSGAAIHPQPTRGWTDQDRWDAVAYLWSLGTTPDRVDVGRRLFSRNCAACHGERGSGDGPGGKSQPKRPADLTNARTMLAGTGSLYTAKIRRGGMGTGMPYWGNIFTEEELAALVDYLWTFSLGTQD
jgi:cytochrome c oxidase subunit 2